MPKHDEIFGRSEVEGHRVGRGVEQADGTSEGSQGCCVVR